MEKKIESEGPKFKFNPEITKLINNHKEKGTLSIEEHGNLIRLINNAEEYINKPHSEEREKHLIDLQRVLIDHAVLLPGLEELVRKGFWIK